MKKGLWSEHFSAADKPTISPCKTAEPHFTEAPARYEVSSAFRMKKGLWSEHFSAADKPTISPCKTAEPHFTEAPAGYERCILCPWCNASSCRLFTANSSKNPGRQFYKCRSLDHNFFKWVDEVKPHEFINVPNCGGCSAGVCRVRREITGPNAGRIMFMCRVKEGEGSCGYRVWQDELEMSGMGEADETISSSQSTTRSQLTDEEADVILRMLDSSEHLHCHEIISPKMAQQKHLEDKPHESSRRPHKRSRCGDAKDPNLLISSHSLTIRVAVNSMSFKHCWMADAIRQNLSSQLHGWWGRIAFHPMPCLITYASKPCYDSFSLDSVFVARDQILVSTIDSSILTRNHQEIESHSTPLFDLEQCYKAPDNEILVNFSDATTITRSLLGAETCGKKKIQTVMSKSISNVFCQAAECLQNELLTLLETTNVKDHEAMSQAAEATFTALDHLLFDHQDFKKRVKELIRCASLLTEIEQSMPTNDSHQKLIEHCCSEKMRLKEISCVHAEATNAMTSNKKRLIILQEEISSTMDWLFQIEAEISCCEVEMRSLEVEFEELSKNKEMLEGKYLTASKELEESQMLLDQKETERNAAKAAFDRARVLLRG